MNLKEDDKLPQGIIKTWNIPKQWAWLTLNDIAEWGSGGTPKSSQSEYYGGDIPWLIIADLNDGVVTKSAKTITELGLKNSSAKLVDKGSILIAMYGSIGKLGIAGIDCTTNQAIAFTKSILEEVDTKYLFYYLRRIRQELLDVGKGGTQANISQTVLKQVEIPIAPLNEQKRIVAKLEKLLAKVNESCDRLSRIPTILKRFRQSVLASACSGRLTADWRKSHPDIESAEELLKKDTGNDINELPQSWCFVSVGDVITELKYGTSKKCSYDKQSHPVLRIPNVVQGVIDCSDLKYTELSDKEYETLRLKIGDILMIRSNGSVSLIGKTAMVTQSEEGFAYAGYLIRLRPNLSLIDPRYLNYYLSSYEIRLQIELPARSTSGVNNINSTEVKKLAIAIPPLEEQKEIVRRVEALFRKCDLIEQRYLTAKAYTDKLTQSILAKAFRGELIPQDSNDEPAEILLERIREEKTLTKKSSKSKKTNKRKTT